MKANLFLNGAFSDYNHIINSDVYTLAADGGVENALKNGITPQAILGDGDSLHGKKYNIPFIHTPDQNFTDFEKALQYLQDKGYTTIDVFCFQGNRIDHMLAGLSVVVQFPALDIVLYTETQMLRKLPHSFSLNCSKGSIISLIPYPEAKKVTTTGLQWNLKNQDFLLGGFISISNKAKANNINIIYEEGSLFLVENMK